MRTTLRLMSLLLRAYVRDRTALFFSFFLPFLFMVIFGSLDFGGTTKVDVGFVDEAANADSQAFASALRTVPALRIVAVDGRTAALERLRRSEFDLVLAVPSEFRIRPVRLGETAAQATVRLFHNEAAPQDAAIGASIVNDVIHRVSLGAAGAVPSVAVLNEPVSGVSLRYVDFLVPGILGMNVMQLNVFSIAFGLVALKQTGALRRILATPLDLRSFVAAHGLMRLILSTVQVGILLAVAFLLFQVKLAGSMLDLLAMAIVGALPFLMLGFALAGWGSSEDQVQPVAQLITLPQFFVSGVFFSKDAAPELIKPLTNVLPLTFLIDGLREIAVQGASLWDVRMQVLGLLAWTVAGFVVAVRLLRLRTA